MLVACCDKEDIEEEETALAGKEEESNIWIGDTGASCHITNCEKGFINIRKVNEGLKVGNGERLEVSKIGDLPIMIFLKDGKETNAVLHDVKYVKNLWCNLFSISSCLEKGWRLGSEGKIIGSEGKIMGNEINIT